MKAESIYQTTTDQLVAAIEAGTPPWRKTWTGGTGLAMRYTGEAYRGANQFLLLLAGFASGFTSPTWLTFRQARAAGGHVKKGEKGFPVIFYKQLPSRDDEEEGVRCVARGYTVFNIEQCEDVRDPNVPEIKEDWSKASDSELDLIIEQLITRAPPIEHNGRGPHYVPSTDIIEMPPRGAFDDWSAYAATLAHECVHSTGHKTRLDREGIACANFNRKGEQYAFEELIAEIGATFLCARFSIAGEHSDNHAAYLASWLKILKGDSRAIFRAAAFAQEATDYLIGKDEAEDEERA